MKCNIGDKVRFLNDVGGGKIVRIIDNKTVGVLNDDGFEIPVLVAEIIVIDSSRDKAIDIRIPVDKHEPEKSNVIKPNSSDKEKVNVDNTASEKLLAFNSTEPEEEDPDGDSLGFLLAFVPKNQLDVANSDLDLFIINDSPYRIFYTIGYWNKNRTAVEPIFSNILVPDSKEQVKEFKKSELNTSLALNIQAIFFKNKAYTAQQPEFFDIELNPVKFYRPGSYIENDFFEEKAMLFTITDSKKEELLKSLTENAINESIIIKDSKPKAEVKQKEPELVEVDLHIQELVDNPSSMQPNEILELQLARFSTALETGLRSKTTRKMVFIHGLGNGKLKNEVIKKLQKEYPKVRYQDASFKEYGFGATLVFLK